MTLKDFMQLRFFRSKFLKKYFNLINKAKKSQLFLKLLNRNIIKQYLFPNCIKDLL